MDKAARFRLPDHELLKDDFICELKGAINVKGKGEMEIWHIVGLGDAAFVSRATQTDSSKCLTLGTIHFKSSAV